MLLYEQFGVLTVTVQGRRKTYLQKKVLIVLISTLTFYEGNA